MLCWSHGLFDAILYIYNRGMQDYITPLEELLCSLSGAVNTGKQLTGKSFVTNCIRGVILTDLSSNHL